jgi:hypothetical protein
LVAASRAAPEPALPEAFGGAGRVPDARHGVLRFPNRG